MVLLKRRGVYAWRSGAGPYAPAGIPDILGCYKGRLVAIEAKRPGKYREPATGLTEPQRKRLLALQGAGALAMVVDSVADVEAHLDDAGIGVVS